MTKTTIFNTNLDNLLELSIEDNNFPGINEEMSALFGDNPTISWAKFILTDDQPNENKVRVPKGEFDNLIKTGKLMPFKMAYAEPNEGHEDSYPMGVIAQLKKSGNQVVAIAALWRKEREADIEFLKTAIAEKRPVNVSWEILHEDSSIDENGIEDLIGTSLRGVTVVGRPAYAGRTPVLHVAAKDAKNDEQENSNSEETKLDELEKLQEKVSELENELEAKKSELAEKTTLLESQEAELASLREYKASVEEEKASAQKFSQIKELFKTAGVTKPDTYFDENREKLMAMNQEDLEFMLQEIVAFASVNKGEEDSSTKDDKNAEIPDITGNTGSEKPSIKELADELRKIH